MKKLVQKMKKAGKKNTSAVAKNDSGRVGYVIAWFLGVPASLLFVIFLIRGH